MLVGCQVLSQAGFDAGALLQQAQSQDVKEELRRRTNEVRLRLLVKCFN
jgi:2-hydroxychromene-2-carboxylate isomerase